MGTTAGGLPFPEGTEAINAGATAIRNLATALDGAWLACTLGAGMSGTVWARRNGASVELIGTATLPAAIPSTILTVPASVTPAFPAGVTNVNFMLAGGTAGANSWLSARVWANRQITVVTAIGAPGTVDFTAVRYPVVASFA